MALVALAQSDSLDADEITIDRLTSSIPNLPLPVLSIPAPPASTSTFRPNAPAASPSYLSSPWDTSPRQPRTPATEVPNGEGGHVPEPSGYSSGSGISGDPANPQAEAERGYWKRLEKVDVELIKEKEGWFLQKYKVTSDVSYYTFCMDCVEQEKKLIFQKRGGETVSRRYSDFVWLLDCMLRRYVRQLSWLSVVHQAENL